MLVVLDTAKKSDESAKLIALHLLPETNWNHGAR
jgi:hypothetical protein